MGTSFAFSNANGATVTVTNPDTNIAPKTIDVSKILQEGDVVGGSVDQATLDQIAANSTNIVAIQNTLTANDTQAKSVSAARRVDMVTVTGGPGVVLDMSNGNYFTINLADGANDLDATNIIAGQAGFLNIVQPAAGNATLTWSTKIYASAGTSPTIATGASARTLIPYFVIGSNEMVLGAPISDFGPIGNTIVVTYTYSVLDDASYNLQPEATKVKIATKLYSTIYKSLNYALASDKTVINSTTFVTDFQTALGQAGTLEPFPFAPGGNTALTRLDFVPLVMNGGLSNFTTSFNQWRQRLLYANSWYNLSKNHYDIFMTYVLMNNITFTNGLEVESVTKFPHLTEHIFQQLLNGISNNQTIEQVVFEHEISISNWARFRSPEDNGREMLEIYNGNFNDTDVPLSAQALVNWRFAYTNIVEPNNYDVLPYQNDDPRSGIAVDEYMYNSNVNANEINWNTTPVTLSDGSSVTSGWEFFAYIVGAKSTDSWLSDGVNWKNPLGNLLTRTFDYGSNSTRFRRRMIGHVVGWFMQQETEANKTALVDYIMSTNPVSFRDIFTTMLLSKNYLFTSNKFKSMEEIFFDFWKKVQWSARYSSASTTVYSDTTDSTVTSVEKSNLQDFQERNPATGNPWKTDYPTAVFSDTTLGRIIDVSGEANQPVNVAKLGRFNVPTDSISFAALQDIFFGMIDNPDYGNERSGVFKSNFWGNISTLMNINGLTPDENTTACYQMYLGRNPTPTELTDIINFSSSNGQSSTSTGNLYRWLALVDLFLRSTEFYQYPSLTEVV